MTAIDEAFDHVDMLSAMDEAFEYADNLDKHHHHHHHHQTAIILSASVLIALGAGFAIKSKMTIVQNKSVEESLLWANKFSNDTKIHWNTFKLNLTYLLNNFFYRFISFKF